MNDSTQLSLENLPPTGAIAPAADAGEAGVRVRGLNLFYGEVQALKDIELDIPDRQVTAFIGPSGCGKTTLLRLLARLYNPPPGTVTVDGDAGRDVEPVGEHDRLAGQLREVHHPPGAVQ